jgi:Flp pilus assembly protein TadG
MKHPRNTRNDHGVVTIELVLAMPFIIALIACSISMAGLYQTKSRVVGAARDYARALAIRPLPASAPADPNLSDGITVSLDGSSARCPALTDPAYQTATPPLVIAQGSMSYTVSIPFVHTWTKTVTEKVSMPCG